MDISRGSESHFEDYIGAEHSHILHYAPLPHAIEFDGNGTFQECKVIAQAYVVKVIGSLQQQFPDLKLFNATKQFSSIFFIVDLTLLHQNACLWLQSFIKHFCTNEGNFVNERGLKSELQGFLDTLQISCDGLKMHQA